MSEGPAAPVGDAAVAAAAPWWQPFATVLRLLSAADPHAALSGAAAARGLVSGGGQPLAFVAADDAGAVPYEAHIAATGRVPTRANAHDLFNALVWLTLPRFKRALNALQARELQAAAHAAAPAEAPRGRGAARDAATLLDENGLLLACGDATVAAALARHDWHGAFVAQRAAWGTTVHAIACGHALLDKLQQPYKAITAHALVLPLALEAPDAAGIAALDAAAAAWIAQGGAAPRALQPLPVLGIPGWCDDNADPGFYADAAVFRPARVPRVTAPAPQETVP